MKMRRHENEGDACPPVLVDRSRESLAEARAVEVIKEHLDRTVGSPPDVVDAGCDATGNDECSNDNECCRKVGKTKGRTVQELYKIYIPDRRKWRAWLKSNHRKSPGVWLIYYKKASGRPRVAYDHAVEEALCFGWIDSTLRSLDEHCYCQMFTPRTNVRNWSDLNRRRLKKLIDAGLMTEAGMAKVHPEVLAAPAPPERERKKPGPVKVTIPAFFRAALRADPVARKNFQALAPSYRRHYVGWLTTAVRAETRAKRLREAMAMLRENKKLGMK